jgi:hypothetical protein
MAMNTDLLLKMMLGGGAAMTQGQSPWPSVAQVGSDQITSENYAALLQKILGGGGKMTLDKDKFSLTGNPSLLGPQPSGVSQGGGVGAAGGGYQGPAAQAKVDPGMATNTPAPDQRQGLGLGFLQQLLNPQGAL